MFNFLLSLEFVKCSFERNDVHFVDIHAEIIERIDFDSSLGEIWITSALQEVQVIEVLI